MFHKEAEVETAIHFKYLSCRSRIFFFLYLGGKGLKRIKLIQICIFYACECLHISLRYTAICGYIAHYLTKTDDINVRFS